MINNRKMKLITESGEATSLRSHASSVKGKERFLAKNIMTADTKDFIQKICYRQTASIDMTQYGFITDSKLNPVNYMIKPLRAQLEKIRVKPVVLKQHRPLSTTSKTNPREVGSPAKPKPSSTTKSVKDHLPVSTPSTTKSRGVASPALVFEPPNRGPLSSQAQHLSHPKSALSNPGTRSTRSCVRKVRIQSDPIPSPMHHQIRL